MQAADLELGAFSDAGPWLVPNEAMVWQHGIGELRARTAARVPDLVRRRKIPPVARAAVTGWHIGGAPLRWELIDQRRNAGAARAGPSPPLRVALSQLRPTHLQPRPNPPPG